MRIRTIKPEFFCHEELAKCDSDARLLAIGLLCMADCDGRLRWIATQVIGNVFPFHPDRPLGEYLQQLEGAGFLRQYTIDGKAYVEITNFRRHQRLSGKEAMSDSTCPPPPEETTQTMAANQVSGGSTTPLPGEAVGIPGKGKGIETPAELASPPSELLQIIDAWNALPEHVVAKGNRTRREPIAKAVLTGWNRLAQDAELKDAFHDVPALFAAIQNATFCHRQGWFTLPWIFAKNKNLEHNAVRLLNGALVARSGPGGSVSAPSGQSAYPQLSVPARKILTGGSP